MSTNATLAVALIANAAGFQSGLAAGASSLRTFGSGLSEAKRALEETKPASEKLEAGIDALAKMAAKGKITVDQMTEAAKNLREKFEGEPIGNKFAEGFKDIAMEILPAVAAAEVFEKAIEHVKEAFEAVGEIGRGANRFGMSVEDFSRLQFAADATHVSIQSFTSGFGKMFDTLGKAGEDKKIGALFQKLKLDADALKDESGPQAFMDISDAIGAHLDTTADKVRAIKEIFGRGGLELSPLINQGSSGLNSLFNESDNANFTRTEEGVKAVESAERSLARQTDELKGHFMDMAQDAAPALTALAESVNGIMLDLHIGEGGKLARDLSMVKQFEEETQAAQRQMDKAQDLKASYAAVKEMVDALTHSMQAYQRTALDMANAGNEEGAATFRNLAVAAREQAETYKAMRDQARGSLPADDDVKEKKGKKTDAERDAEHIAASVREMEKLVDTYGKSREAIQLYNLQMLGADAETLKYAKSLQTQYEHLEASAKAHKHLEEAMKPLFSLAERLTSKSPEDHFSKDFVALTAALVAGKIGWAEYTKAIEAAQAAMAKLLDHGKTGKELAAIAQLAHHDQTPAQKFADDMAKIQRQFDAGNIDSDEALDAYFGAKSEQDKAGKHHGHSSGALAYNPNLIDPRHLQGDENTKHLREIAHNTRHGHKPPPDRHH